MKKYSIVYADPPWRFKHYSKFSDDKLNRRYGRATYQTMDIESIKKWWK